MFAIKLVKLAINCGMLWRYPQRQIYHLNSEFWSFLGRVLVHIFHMKEALWYTRYTLIFGRNPRDFFLELVPAGAESWTAREPATPVAR